MSKQILHLDMDAFFASIEQASNPQLRQQPIIVGSRNNKYRTVVAACSYQAKAFGIESGMPAAQALRLCPQAIFVPADCSKYVYTAQKIYQLLQEFSPQVEMASIDEFNLDITGCARLFGGLENIGRLIKQKLGSCLGITGSIGIAPNKLMAKVASKTNKPDGLGIWSKADLPAKLENLPVEKIPGIGPKISLYLSQISVFTCGQLSRVPERRLVSLFGQYGSWLKIAARGEGPDCVGLSQQPELPPKSVGHSYTLEKDINSIELIRAWIRLLCEMVAVRLRKLLLQASVVHLYLRGPNLQWWSKQKKFPEATFDGQAIYQRCLIILSQVFKPIGSVRALGVSVSGLSLTEQLVLFESERKRQELLFALDSLNSRFGERTIYPANLAAIDWLK